MFFSSFQILCLENIFQQLYFQFYWTESRPKLTRACTRKHTYNNIVHFWLTTSVRTVLKCVVTFQSLHHIISLMFFLSFFQCGTNFIHSPPLSHIESCYHFLASSFGQRPLLCFHSHTIGLESLLLHHHKSTTGQPTYGPSHGWGLFCSPSIMQATLGYCSTWSK